MSDWLRQIGQQRPELVGQRVNAFDPQFGFRFGEDGSWNGPMLDEYRETATNRGGEYGDFYGIRDNAFHLGGRGAIGGISMGQLDPRNLTPENLKLLGSEGWARVVTGPNGNTVTPPPVTPPPTTPPPGAPPVTPPPATRPPEFGGAPPASGANVSGEPVGSGPAPTNTPTGGTVPLYGENPNLPLPPNAGPTGGTGEPKIYPTTFAPGGRPGTANPAVVNALMRRFRPASWF